MNKLTVLLCFQFLFLATACTPKNRNFVKAKVFALNPGEYIGKRVFLVGKVKKTGPAGSFFVFEDESGRVLVTSERVARPTSCEEGAPVTLSGKLLKTPSSDEAFFSMDSLLECGTAQK